MSIGGGINDPVGTRWEIERHAWVSDDTVKCWACGYEYLPYHKPGQKPRLKMGRQTPIKSRNPPTVGQFYKLEYGSFLKPYAMRAKARKVA